MVVCCSFPHNAKLGKDVEANFCFYQNGQHKKLIIKQLYSTILKGNNNFAFKGLPFFYKARSKNKLSLSLIKITNKRLIMSDL